MRFKKLVFCVAAALLALTLHAGFAEAITFNLDTIINGNTSLTPGQPSFGTITFTQDGNSVDVTASLSNSNWKLLSFDFNYNPSLGSNPALTLSSGTLEINEFNIKPDGYSGYLDLSIPANGNLGNISTYTTTISLNNGSTKLDASDFYFKDTLGNLYVAVHIGDYLNGNSIWVGAETTGGPVPEPATMLLLGSGLVALGVFKGRKRSKA